MWKQLVSVAIAVVLLGILSSPVLGAGVSDIGLTATPQTSIGVADFVITYVSDTRLDIDWTLVGDAVNIMIRAQYNGYPDNPPDEDTAPSDGYLVYYGSATSCSDETMDFNQSIGPLYYRAWAQKADGKWYLVPREGEEESIRMVNLTACIVFLGMAMTFSILGHMKRQWWFSTIGALTWLAIFFWWMAVGVEDLFGMTGSYTDIIAYLPLMLVFFVLADIVSYWNTVEIRNQGRDGKTWTTFGGVPRNDGPSSYEAYRAELRRRLRR
jgi:hypothetical protein